MRNTLNLRKTSFYALLYASAGIFLATPLCAWSAAGKILFASGSVKIINAAGQERNAKRGDTLEPGDTIVTGSASSLQARLDDGGVIAVRPDTQLKIDEFSYKNKNPKQDKALFSLSKGAFRSITGAIANQNKEAYQINTPSASIGIRGTDHEPLVIPVPQPGQAALGAPGTYDKVNSGATILQTPKGMVEIKPNQVGFVASRNEAPVVLPQIPAFYQTSQSPAPNNSSKEGSQTATNSPTEATQANADTQTSSDTQAGTTTSSTDTTSSSGTATASSDTTTSSSTTTTASGSTTSTTSTTTTTPTTTDLLSASTVSILPTTTTTSTNTTTTTTVPPTNTSTLLGGTPAPIGSGGAGADTWIGPYGHDSGSGSMLVDGSSGNSVLLGTKGEVVFISDSTTGSFQFSANGAPLIEANSIFDSIANAKISWGRWGVGYSVIDMGTAKNSVGNFHYIYSPDITPLSTIASLTGTKNFNYAGGTLPTDQYGNVGNIISAKMTVDFSAQQISYLEYGVNIAGNSWVTVGNGSIANFTNSGTGPGGIPLIGTCTGNCNVGGASVPIDSMSNASGHFVGPNAGGVISTFNLKAGDHTATGAVYMK